MAVHTGSVQVGALAQFVAVGDAKHVGVTLCVVVELSTVFKFGLHILGRDAEGAVTQRSRGPEKEAVGLARQVSFSNFIIFNVVVAFCKISEESAAGEASQRDLVGVLVHKGRLNDFEIPRSTNRVEVHVLIFIGSIRCGTGRIGFTVSRTDMFVHCRQSEGAIFVLGTDTIVVSATGPYCFVATVFEGSLQRNRQTVNGGQFHSYGVIESSIFGGKKPHTAITIGRFERIKVTDEVKVAAGRRKGTAQITSCKFHRVVTNPEVGHGIEKLVVISPGHRASVGFKFVFESETDLPTVAKFFFAGQTEHRVAGPSAFHRGRVLRRGFFAIKRYGICMREHEPRGHRTVEFHVGSHRRTRKGAENGNRSKRFFHLKILRIGKLGLVKTVQTDGLRFMNGAIVMRMFLTTKIFTMKRSDGFPKETGRNEASLHD